MASGKGAALAAVAVASLLAVKVLPWVVGYFGGKHLYEMATITPVRAAELTAADMSEALQKQGFETFRIFKQDFPEDYDLLIQKVLAPVKAGDDDERFLVADAAAIAGLRRKYALAVRSAPDSEAAQALRAYLDTVKRVIAVEIPATCNQYLTTGPRVLAIRDNDMAAAVDRWTAALFHAIGAGRKSSLPTAEPGDDDWSRLDAPFTAAGGLPDDKDAIIRKDRGYKALCPAFARFLEAVLSVEGEPGRRIRTNILYGIASQ
jgi:hypothetical protein